MAYKRLKHTFGMPTGPNWLPKANSKTGKVLLNTTRAIYPCRIMAIISRSVISKYANFRGSFLLLSLSYKLRKNAFSPSLQSRRVAERSVVGVSTLDAMRDAALTG